MIELQYLIATIYILFYTLIIVTITAVALIVVLTIVLGKGK